MKPLTWKWNRPEWVLLDNEHDASLLECVGYVRQLRRKMEGFCYKCGWKLQDCTELTDAREQLVDHMVDAHELCGPVDSSHSTRETCPIPRAQANEARPVTCGECRNWNLTEKWEFDEERTGIVVRKRCTCEDGLRNPKRDGSSSCSYGERKARGE